MTTSEAMNISEISRENPTFFLDDETLKKWKILGEHETLDGAYARVAKSVAAFEKQYPDGDADGFETEIMEQLRSKKMIPSTPILMNAGRFEHVPLSACVVPPVELREDWAKIKAKVDEMHFQGMGTGFNFDETDDPVALIKFLNQVGIDGQKDARQLRPVGNIGTMTLDNPNILSFVNLKDNAEVTHENWVFNLSVSMNDEQIASMLNNGEIELRDGKKLSADALLSNIACAIWLSGDPGLVFMDRIRADNTVPAAGEAVSMAPCGEIGLSRGESCQFTYINLGKFIRNDRIDYGELKKTIGFAVRFLDDVVDYNIQNATDPDGIAMARNKRKIGLGVCGFDDLLKGLYVQYGSDESIKVAGELFSFINYQSKKASIELAKQRGSFDMFHGSQLSHGDSHMMAKMSARQTETVSCDDWASLIEEIKNSGIRHCSTIALPPTGRSSQIIGVSQSIEPDFKEFLNISSHDQIRMLDTIQQFVDESISKTINVGNDTTVDDIKTILLDSMEHDLKGITIYRDGSRSNQPKVIKS